MRPSLQPALVLLLLGACAPQPPSPVRVMGLTGTKAGTLEPRELSLKTLTDAVALKGSVATLIGGARIVFDTNDPALQSNGGNLSDAQLKEVFVKSKGLPPRASYIEKNGVLWPADFHSWNLVSLYANLEHAYSYFQGAYDGQSSDALLGVDLYYFPFFVLAELTASAQVDNALFFTPVQGFAILPFERLDKVPLALNLGVLGHEYSHRVFNQRTYGGRAFPEPFFRWTDALGSATPALNVLKAIDEGLADFHAYGITCASEAGCNPRFLLASLDLATTDDRDLSKPDKCLTASQKAALETLPLTQFIGQQLEYRVGTALAASLYQAGNKTGKMAILQKAVVASYADSATQTPGLHELIDRDLLQPQLFTLASVANAILSHVTDLDLQRQTCNEFLDRLRIECASFPCDALPACPASAQKGTSCPP